MRLDDDWHRVTGPGLTDARDCCGFGMRTADGWLVFDAGTGLAEPWAGLEGAVHLFLTHGHADHAGGAAAMVARGAGTYAGALTAAWLAGPDEAAVSLPVARAAGVYPADYRLRAVAVDHVLADEAVVRLGGVEVHAVATPGHSDDHVSYLVTAGGRRTLVGGDAIFADGSIILQDTWDSSVARSCASVRRLATLAFDTLLPGHGPVLLAGGRTAVETAMDRVARLLPPRNFM